MGFQGGGGGSVQCYVCVAQHLRAVTKSVVCPAACAESNRWGHGRLHAEHGSCAIAWLDRPQQRAVGGGLPHLRHLLLPGCPGHQHAKAVHSGARCTEPLPAHVEAAGTATVASVRAHDIPRGGVLPPVFFTFALCYSPLPCRGSVHCVALLPTVCVPLSVTCILEYVCRSG